MHLADFQHAVMLWMERCFGRATDGTKKSIRNFRFYEEATELVQAAGMTREEAHRQVDYTFNRPAGKPPQELGGVLVTLAAWAGTHGLQMSEHGPAELMRIDTPEMITKIRAKQASKPGENGPPRPSSDPVPSGVLGTFNEQQEGRDG
jgi:hypothetical protein